MDFVNHNVSKLSLFKSYVFQLIMTFVFSSACHRVCVCPDVEPSSVFVYNLYPSRRVGTVYYVVCVCMCMYI